MSERSLDDLLYGEKAPQAFTFTEDGQEVTFKVIKRKPWVSQERKFIRKGTVGPLLFWQGKVLKTEDEVDYNKPHQPLEQIVSIVSIKDVGERTIYWNGDKKKALLAFLRENRDVRFDEGTVGRLKMWEEDTGAPQPKKRYEVLAMKSPKE